MSKRHLIEFISRSAGNDGKGGTILVFTMLPQDRTNVLKFNLANSTIQIGKIVDEGKERVMYGFISRRKLRS